MDENARIKIKNYIMQESTYISYDIYVYINRKIVIFYQ